MTRSRGQRPVRPGDRAGSGPAKTDRQGRRDEKIFPLGDDKPFKTLVSDGGIQGNPRESKPFGKDFQGGLSGRRLRWRAMRRFFRFGPHKPLRKLVWDEGIQATPRKSNPPGQGFPSGPVRAAPFPSPAWPEIAATPLTDLPSAKEQSPAATGRRGEAGVDGTAMAWRRIARLTRRAHSL